MSGQKGNREIESEREKGTQIHTKKSKREKKVRADDAHPRIHAETVGSRNKVNKMRETTFPRPLHIEEGKQKKQGLRTARRKEAGRKSKKKGMQKGIAGKTSRKWRARYIGTWVVVRLLL